MEILIQCQRDFACGQALGGSFRFRRAMQAHQAGVACEIEAAALDVYFLSSGIRGWRACALSLAGHRRRRELRQLEAHVLHQSNRAFVGVVLHADGFAAAVRESEDDALVGARDTGGAIEGYAAGLHASG